MAGTKGRSGRRQKFAAFQPEAEAPKLEAPYTVDACMHYIAWVASEQAAGRMDRADARELRDHAKAIMNGITRKHAMHELEEARAIAERIEAANEKREKLIREEIRLGGAKAH
ncbi:MAG TPA: hypothetical protein VEJ18_19190 [Planctomycetota bacterium]|nr:hypothetical protein [Planctomycetota bacterium]